MKGRALEFVVGTLVMLATAWIAYDVWIVMAYGLNSGETISWQIYAAALQYPAIPFFSGLVIGLLCGHLFLGMKTS